MKLAFTTGLLCLAGIAASAQAAPVKIGLIETLSGPQASTGLIFRAAVKYQLDRINAAGGWNGQPLELVEFDNQGGPVGASDRFRAAAAEGVQILVQGSSSAISGQLTEDVRKHNLRNPGKEVLFLNVGGEALELTGQKCHFYHFRFATNADLRVKALTSVMSADGTLGKRVYAINQNYSWGQDMEGATERFAKQYGYEVVGKTLHEVNKIQDFAPYVARIRSANPDTVITGNWSNDLLLLMKATQAAGLKVRFATVFLDQVGNLANAGEVALGHYIAHPYNIEAAGERRQVRRGLQGQDRPLPQLHRTADRDRRHLPGRGAQAGQAAGRQAVGAGTGQGAGEGHLHLAAGHLHDARRGPPGAAADGGFQGRQERQVQGRRHRHGLRAGQVLSAADVSAPVQSTCKMVRPN